jgi:hypothetical protein
MGSKVSHDCTEPMPTALCDTTVLLCTNVSQSEYTRRPAHLARHTAARTHTRTKGGQKKRGGLRTSLLAQLFS